MSWKACRVMHLRQSILEWHSTRGGPCRSLCESVMIMSHVKYNYNRVESTEHRTLTEQNQIELDFKEVLFRVIFRITHPNLEVTWKRNNKGVQACLSARTPYSFGGVH